MQKTIRSLILQVILVVKFSSLQLKVVFSSDYTFSYIRDSGPVNFLSVYLQDTGLFNGILDHGCWCNIFDPNSNKLALGGHNSQVDDVDSLCHDWLDCRLCSVKYEGGECYTHLTSIENYEYSVYINENTGRITCNTHSPIDGREYNVCEFETCVIDKFYVEAIGDLIRETYVDSSEFTANITSSESCHRNVNPNGSGNGNGKVPQVYTYECEGIAPFLHIKKNAVVEEELTNNTISTTIAPSLTATTIIPNNMTECLCEWGLPTNEFCPIDDNQKCLGESYCYYGYHYDNSTNICQENQCFCPDGRPFSTRPGQYDCPVNNIEHCMLCNEFYHEEVDEESGLRKPGKFFGWVLSII